MMEWTSEEEEREAAGVRSDRIQHPIPTAWSWVLVDQNGRSCDLPAYSLSCPLCVAAGHRKPQWMRFNALEESLGV